MLGVALVILSILGIAAYSYKANRAGALTLSEAVLDALQHLQEDHGAGRDGNSDPVRARFRPRTRGGNFGAHAGRSVGICPAWI